MVRTLYTFTSHADGTTARVMARPHDYAVTLTDDDTGVTLPTVRAFRHEAEAVAHAAGLVSGYPALITAGAPAA